MSAYVHGYSAQEAIRLDDQASTLARLLYGDIRYPEGSTVLEAGCGTGSQTVHLARGNPHASFVCLDRSGQSLARAAGAVDARGLGNVRLVEGDLYDLPFADGQFDHIFVCFVLEHLAEPLAALAGLARVLRPGGTLTVIEGDHGSFYCHPESAAARGAVDCLVRLQAELGGDALIGRRLYPLMREAGLTEVSVEPRMVYVDGSTPGLIEGFSRNTFNAMVQGVGEEVIARGLTDARNWAQGLADLNRAATPEGVFCYTFFRGQAIRGEASR